MVRRACGRSGNPIGTVRQLLAILASPDRTEGLREVRVPTLVVHGLADQLVAPSGGIATARAVPGSRLLMFPDMGHDLPAPRRGEIVEAIAQNAARAATVDAGRPAGSAQGRRDRVDEHPDLLLGDDERRREADRRAVGVLGEDAAREQPSHSSRPVPRAGSMSMPAHRPRTADRRRRRRRPAAAAVLEQERRARPARAWNSPVSSIATTSWPTAAASGLPPKVEPWVPGVMTLEDVAVARRWPRPGRCRRRGPCRARRRRGRRPRGRRRRCARCGRGRTGSRRRRSARRRRRRSRGRRGR